MTQAEPAELTMVDALTAAQGELQTRIRTVVPCVVVSYNALTQSASVQPAPSNRRTQGDPEPLTPIPDAPVVFPAGGGWSMSWPLAPGDAVLAMCSDRGISRWRAQGTPFVPGSRRMHAIADAFVWPGGGPAPTPDGTPSAANMRIEGPGGVAFEVTPAGTITLAGQGVPLPVARAGDAVSVTSDALLELKTALTAWVPVAGDGGAALAGALATFIALSDADVVQGLGTITDGSELVSCG